MGSEGSGWMRSSVMYLTRRSCTLKNGEDGEFYVIYILPQFKKTYVVRCVCNRFINSFNVPSGAPFARLLGDAGWTFSSLCASVSSSANWQG